MQLHFDSVFYYVSDLDRSIRFYRDVLGLPLRSRDVVARFDVDGVLFELAPAPQGTEFSCQGNARLCLCVDDVASALQELSGKGIRVRGPEEKSNGVLGSFEDPDGNELCLWQYTNETPLL